MCRQERYVKYQLVQLGLIDLPLREPPPGPIPQAPQLTSTVEHDEM